MLFIPDFTIEELFKLDEALAIADEYGGVDEEYEDEYLLWSIGRMSDDDISETLRNWLLKHGLIKSR